MNVIQDFLNRRVWITGASSGIGHATALEFARRGAKVALSARRVTELQALARQCDPDKVLVVPLDVTSRKANAVAVDAITRAWGGLDIAFLNAGAGESNYVGRFDSGVFERMMSSNFLSIVYGIEAALPVLRKASYPHIVGMSSIASYAGMPQAAAYSASKAAVRNMLQGLRIDLRAEGIAVSTVCPGFVRTPMTDHARFPMPFLVEVDVAARTIVDGIAKRPEEIHFPTLFSWIMKALTSLPCGAYTRIMSKVTHGQ